MRKKPRVNKGSMADEYYATVDETMDPPTCAGVNPSGFDGRFWTSEDAHHTDIGLDSLRKTLGASNDFLADIGAAGVCGLRRVRGAVSWTLSAS